MILSRVWYVILGLAVAVALYVVYVAVGQYNRQTTRALKEGLAAAAERLLHLLQSTKLPDYVRKTDLVTDVRRRLQQRSAHWYAEALKAAREAHEA